MNVPTVPTSSRASSLPLGGNLLAKEGAHTYRFKLEIRIWWEILRYRKSPKATSAQLSNQNRTPQPRQSQNQTAPFYPGSRHTAERNVRCRLSSGADPVGNRHGCRLSCTGHGWPVAATAGSVSGRRNPPQADPTEPGALPTLVPSKWVAEGRKGDQSRSHRSLNPQFRRSSNYASGLRQQAVSQEEPGFNLKSSSVGSICGSESVDFRLLTKRPANPLESGGPQLHLLKISEVLTPPNAKLLFMTYSLFIRLGSPTM